MKTGRVGRLLALGAAMAFLGLPAFAAIRLAPASPATSATASPSDSPASASPEEAARNADASCLVCHSSPEILTSRPGSRATGLLVGPQTLVGSVHASLGCTSCHPPASATLHADPAAELAAVRSSCGKCHQSQALDYLSSPHGSKTSLPESRLVGPPPSDSPRTLPSPIARQTGRAGEKPQERPTCVVCHGAHQVVPARSRSFIAAASGQCSRCHTERGESFFDRNYHGKETRLGRNDVASCADCHGPHLVLPESDPGSKVYAANRLETCRQCHRSASGNFADIKIHVAGRPLPDDPKLKAVAGFMTLLVVVTFAFFGSHTALALGHAWRAKSEGKERETSD